MAGERLAGVVLLTLAAFEATVGLPAAFAALGSARAAERRLAEVIEAPPAMAEPASPQPAGPGLRLEVRDLRFTYHGALRPTLDGVSLVLEPGRVVALVGASGSGKSTLARLLARSDGGVLLVTHRYAGLAMADEVLVLDRGKLRERGRFADLVSARGVVGSLGSGLES
jgi:ABC-type transport system involved in cytochrome bd biosynthesis fused ATPase/permease subunit